ncbi:MAG: exodeoxyribonuclease VII large subunit [Magnetococcales bacterium]|nr:exodeoxyribonuclease VII large subunit [Magnetococcales bacterium]
METSEPHWNDILSVTGLNEAIRDLLENRFAYVRVRGELSDLAQPASGHVYFALIDGQSRIRCVIWKGNRKRLNTQPKIGQSVIITGRIAVYAPRGEYQLIVEGMQDDGAGDARERLLKLHAQLSREGLFDPDRKRPLPYFPGVIGIVTSRTGAALQDVIRVLDDRRVGYHLLVAHARVQGDQAALEIVSALQQLVADGRPEVIICGRGGGSTDDLAVFNDERIVRAIAASPIPIISAVGHEVDTTLVDLAADVRAPTPSAAAQMVMPELDHLQQRLWQARQNLIRGFSSLLVHHQHRLSQTKGRLTHPRRHIDSQRFRIDELTERLHNTTLQALQRRVPELSNLQQRLKQWPARTFPVQQTRLQHDQQRLSQVMRVYFLRQADQLAALIARLHGVSPKAVLDRGYALVYNKRGTLQKSGKTVKPGDIVTIHLVDAEFDATVQQVRKPS